MFLFIMMHWKHNIVVGKQQHSAALSVSNTEPAQPCLQAFTDAQHRVRLLAPRQLPTCPFIGNENKVIQDLFSL